VLQSTVIAKKKAPKKAKVQKLDSGELASPDRVKMLSVAMENTEKLKVHMEKLETTRAIKRNESILNKDVQSTMKSEEKNVTTLEKRLTALKQKKNDRERSS
jgi:hypothetical protein